MDHLQTVCDLYEIAHRLGDSTIMNGSEAHAAVLKAAKKLLCQLFDEAGDYAHERALETGATDIDSLSTYLEYYWLVWPSNRSKRG